MIQLTYDEAEELEEKIKNMEYRPGNNGDNWYPEKEEIDAYISEYNNQDIRFLIALLYPKFELSPKQKEVQNYVRNLLTDEKVIKYLDDDEQEDLSDILEKYNQKH